MKLLDYQFQFLRSTTQFFPHKIRVKIRVKISEKGFEKHCQLMGAERILDTFYYIKKQYFWISLYNSHKTFLTLDRREAGG